MPPPSTDDTFAEETIDGCSDEESEISASEMVIPNFIPPSHPPSRPPSRPAMPPIMPFEHECDLASEIDDIYTIQRKPSIPRNAPLPACLRNFQSANGSHSPESSYYNGGEEHLVKKFKPVVQELQYTEVGNCLILEIYLLKIEIFVEYRKFGQKAKYRSK